MKDEYLKELKQLKIKMIEAEKFAEKIPVFAGQILDYKYTGNENWIKFGEKYKDTYERKEKCVNFIQVFQMVRETYCFFNLATLQK